MSSSGRPMSAAMTLKSSRAGRREAHELQSAVDEQHADLGGGDEVLQIVVDARHLVDLGLQLLIDGRQLLVDRLQLLLAGLELLGSRAQLLVDRLQLLVRRLQLLVLRLVLLDRRRAAARGCSRARFPPLRTSGRPPFPDRPVRRRHRPRRSRRRSPARTYGDVGTSRTGWIVISTNDVPVGRFSSTCLASTRFIVWNA